MHAKAIKVGFDGNVVVGNSLIHIYIKCGLIMDARMVFDELIVRDIISFKCDCI